MWFWVGLGWLPVTVAAFMVLAFTVPYGIAVGLGHVPAGFPYISDTGTDPPESCIFGQLLNMASALALATMYVRYKQVAEFYHEVPIRVLKWNKVALVLGALAAFGMSLVANFQETNLLVVHFIGATMCFCLGFIYGFIQSYISYKMSPQYCSFAVCRLRLVLTSLATLFFITTMVFAGIASSQWQGEDKTKWLPDDGGYVFHIVSTASEWAMAIAFLLFFASYIVEFQKIEIAAEVRRCEMLLDITQDPLA